MPFKKGQSGNPGGKPKELKGIQELARIHSAKAISTLAGIMNDPKAGAAARATAADKLLDRAYGKPPQFSTADASQFRRAIEMSDDELANIAGRGSEGTYPAPVDPQKLN